MNDTIVTTNGAFDVMHIGHVRLLQFAKSLGDKLIVGLNSDESIKAYKSPFRPINPQAYRKEFLEALDCVDEVRIFDELTCDNFIRDIEPDYHIKAKSTLDRFVEAGTLEEVGGVLAVFDDIKNYSSTDILKRGANILYKEQIRARGILA